MFQSTHPYGVRPPICCLYMIAACFNPRTHMGCDMRALPYNGKMDCFNPRTHMGCDQARPAKAETKDSFNPRTHMGCDSYSDVPTSTHQGFNPRTHMGCDAPSYSAKVQKISVSIHAPIWGATLSPQL